MTLDDLLGKFHTPIEAATVANLGRTAAWHWFAKGTKRSLPSVRTEQAKKRASALQSRLDENVEKEIDWEEKEKILELKRIEKLLEEQLK